MNTKTFIAVLVLSLMIVSSAFAADVDKMGNRWGIGLFGTTPTVRINFSESVSTQIGVGYEAPNSNAVGSPPGILNALLLLSFKGSTTGVGGKNALTWGILGRHSSNASFVSGNSSTNFGITMGYETLINPNFIVGLTIIPAQYTSNVTNGGATSSNNWGILNEAQITGHILL